VAIQILEIQFTVDPLQLKSICYTDPFSQAYTFKGTPFYWDALYRLPNKIASF